MHPLLFSLKRTHQATLRLARPVLEPHGLTPARYDLLQLLWGHKNGVPQRHLRKILGVTRATVSRMLCSLEDIGFVRREVCPYDRRCKDVWLTDEGAAHLEAAYTEVVKPGWIQFALDWALGTLGLRDLLPPRFCYREMAELDRHLVKIRRAFCDTGSLVYRR